MDLTHLADVGQGALHRAYIWTQGGGDGKLGWEVQAGTNKLGATTNNPFYKYAIFLGMQSVHTMIDCTMA